MGRINKNLNETIERMKSLFTEERMFGNLVDDIETYEGDIEGEESESAKPSCCTSCNCWADCGGESYFNGSNGRPKIVISKSDSYFSVSYDGPTTGYLIKHGKCENGGGTGDSIHQLCNVLTYEINKYLKGKKLKPDINNIDYEKSGNEFTIGVPLESSDKSYKLERRGRWNGGEAGKEEVIGKYENMPGYDKKVMPVRYSSGGIIEYFVTFYE